MSVHNIGFCEEIKKIKPNRTDRFYHGSKHYEPKWSSLFWVHIVCNFGYVGT